MKGTIDFTYRRHFLGNELNAKQAPLLLSKNLLTLLPPWAYHLAHDLRTCDCPNVQLGLLPNFGRAACSFFLGVSRVWVCAMGFWDMEAASRKGTTEWREACAAGEMESGGGSSALTPPSSASASERFSPQFSLPSPRDRQRQRERKERRRRSMRREGKGGGDVVGSKSVVTVRTVVVVPALLYVKIAQ